MCPDKSIYCAHKTMTLRTQTMSTTFTNNFCACQLSPFTDIRLICSVLAVLLVYSFNFRHVLTAAWQQWMLDSDSTPESQCMDYNDFAKVTVICISPGTAFILRFQLTAAHLPRSLNSCLSTYRCTPAQESELLPMDVTLLR